jgi:thiol-disulfide isomerase/thioredoxin
MKRSGVIAGLLSACLLGAASAQTPPAGEAAHPLQPVPRAAEQPSGLPPVFSSMSFEDALKDTIGSDKVLVAKATAEWCVPCKTMDRTTWRDARIEGWFKENGRVIAIDIDRNKEWMRDHNIGPIPTMIAFRNGKDFDRVIGLQSADELLAWLDGVKQGKSASDAIVKRLDEARAGRTQVSIQEWSQIAGNLVVMGKLDEAANEYAWLWDNMLTREPRMSGVRTSFMATSMQKLAAQHPPALERFKSLRDAAMERAKAAGRTEEATPADISAIEDYLALNKIVGDDVRSVEWFRAFRTQPGAKPILPRVSYRLEELLAAQGLWSEMAALYPDPDAKVEFDSRNVDSAREYAKKLPSGQGEELNRQMIELYRETIARMHASLLAAHRGDEAKGAAEAAIKYDDTPAMRVALVRWSLIAKQKSEMLKQWLDEAAAKGENVEVLREQLKAFEGT